MNFKNKTRPWKIDNANFYTLKLKMKINEEEKYLLRISNDEDSK
jgi:hypothetical protein